METDNLIQLLNDLLEKNLDAARGYEEATEQQTTPALRSFFVKSMSMRDQFADELDGEIVELGGEPVTETSFTSDLHRAWINLKSAWSDDENHAVLEECIRGEEASLRDYDQALNTLGLPDHIRKMFLDHRNNISMVLKELRDAESMNEDLIN